ncbi:MAG: ECF transporter S component [Saccharofermentanales bacterium]
MNRLTRKQKTNWIAKTGILAAASIILMFLEFPLPLMPGFLKFDVSEVPVLLAAFALGPWSAIIIEFIKNLAHFPFTSSAGVGEIANFIVGCAFVVPAGVFYRYHRNKKGAIVSMIIGVSSMTLVGCVANYFVLIPFYIKVLEFPMAAIVGMVAAAGNKLVKDLPTLIVFVFAPFNIFKGVIVSFIVALIYKRISPLLHKEIIK